MIPMEGISLGGWGLPEFVKKLEELEKQPRTLFVQLPTPIRSFPEEPEILKERTLCWLRKFRSSGWEDERLLKLYWDDLERIKALHPSVVFFMYNVGGYPLRAPYDFGVRAENDMLAEFARRGWGFLRCTFEGRPGFAKREKRVDREFRKRYLETLDLDIVHPDGCIVIDPHPNRSADVIAATQVRDYAKSKGLLETS
jgi:hypothetical protein